MANTTTHGPHDLLVVLDATASMGNFIDALNKSLPEIISLSALTGCFERIGIIAYRDYCGGQLIEWSGWCSPSGVAQGPDIVSQDDVLNMARDIQASYGGDMPEAAKTGFAKAYQEMRENATTIILFYADAPPHFEETGGQNYKKERAALGKTGSYGGTGRLFADWTSAARALRVAPKKAVVFSITVETSIPYSTSFLYLSTATRGAQFATKPTSEQISKLTLGLLLTWMGAGHALENDETYGGDMLKYKTTSKLGLAKSDSEEAFHKYVAKFSGHDYRTVSQNITRTKVALKDMPSMLEARGPSVCNFAKKYIEEENYKKLAVEQLGRIIVYNVSAISLNPIFGSLWRTVCNDRTNPAREGLISAFGNKVDRISIQYEKARMKAWLEESYDYASEIQRVISTVPQDQRFPLVYLDPTADLKSGAEDAGNLEKLTRAELLEIGRSCDYRILRRLGKILTHLSYATSEDELPEHIKASDADRVPQIPMALANEEFGNKFWKVLLHVVLPGTMITARPAAVFAALALRMGIVPLRSVADQELISFRDKWNTLEIPETWNLGCLGLLLDADKDYENRVAEGITTRPSPNTSILKKEDRKLFETLVDYKMLELNMKTTIKAKIGWKPDKSKVALGTVVVCRLCKYPRSVTAMASNGICGQCDVRRKSCPCGACSASENHRERLVNNVSKEHDENTLACWVECSRIQCRAQYVIYNPQFLNVRPKCFYCRHSDGRSAEGPAPVVECSKCLSRVVWPVEYRPKTFDWSKFECSACSTDIVTIITAETTAEKISKENGTSWVLENNEKAIQDAFNGRSLFHTASHCDLANLSSKVKVLPPLDTHSLTIAGKLVRNKSDVRVSLQDWVFSRRTESAVCSLCFADNRKDNIRLACGRKGCHQLICNDCMQGWYGINGPGRLINIAALSCPFCRRRPVPKTIANFGLTRLINLRGAVERAGSWIYAWCIECDTAKEYMERACEAGAPAELSGWKCEGCQLPGGKIRIKPCPSCGILTEKDGGCDHITCHCGKHWCFACGQASSPGAIYAHMNTEHGGWFGIEEDEDDDEDEIVCGGCFFD